MLWCWSASQVTGCWISLEANIIRLFQRRGGSLSKTTSCRNTRSCGRLSEQNNKPTQQLSAAKTLKAESCHVISAVTDWKARLLFKQRGNALTVIIFHYVNRKSRCAVTPPTLHMLSLRRCPQVEFKPRRLTRDPHSLRTHRCALRLHRQVPKTKRTVPLERALPWIFSSWEKKTKNTRAGSPFRRCRYMNTPTTAAVTRTMVSAIRRTPFLAPGGTGRSSVETTRINMVFKLYKHMQAIRKQRRDRDCTLFTCLLCEVAKKNQEKLPVYRHWGQIRPRTRKYLRRRKSHVG